MSLHRLFCPDLRVGENTLSGDEAHHALQALRLAVGSSVVLIDGQGHDALAQVTRVSRRELSLEVTEITEHGLDASIQLTLAVSMPKTHRQGYLVEKCTELGVAALWPLVTARTVAKPGEAAIEKWQRRAIEAVKQSGRRWVPQIAAPQRFDGVLETRPVFDRAAIAHADDQAVPAPEFLTGSSPGGKVLVLVGPEGGWTDFEREAASSAGFTGIRLTSTTLRTETAAVALAAICGISSNLGT